jgi:hypothetical protein
VADQFWLDDDRLAHLARQTPSTQFGVELMAKWPARYPGLLSSDTYRGCAIVLSKLVDLLANRSVTTYDIEQAIEAVDRMVKSPTALALGDDLRGGAGLTTANAWESAHSGVSPQQVVAAYESELIYAAKMFLTARGRELSGHRLP